MEGYKGPFRFACFAKNSDANQTKQPPFPYILLFAKQKSTSLSKTLVWWHEVNRSFFIFVTDLQNVLYLLFLGNGCETSYKYREVAARFACFAGLRNSNTLLRIPIGVSDPSM